MPTYQYACTACEHRFEAVQSFSDASLTECPECEGRLRKVFSNVGIVFKGSGFYRTDSRAAPTGDAPAKEKAGASAAKEGSGGDSGSSASSSTSGSSSSGSSSSGSTASTNSSSSTTSSTSTSSASSAA